jgi:hypothetical protein
MFRVRAGSAPQGAQGPPVRLPQHQLVGHSGLTMPRAKGGAEASVAPTLARVHEASVLLLLYRPRLSKAHSRPLPAAEPQAGIPGGPELLPSASVRPGGSAGAL